MHHEFKIWAASRLVGCFKVVCLALTLVFFSAFVHSAEPNPSTLTIVVMDPLSGPLACDCVKGYAQRKYEKLGEFLQAELKRPVKVYWSESLHEALEEKTKGKADLVIGKHSVVAADAKESRITLRPIARLTGKDGKTTQTGLFIVRTGDKAQSMGDLAGYRILFGPADCDEKYASPMVLMKKSGLPVPDPVETSPSCSDAAKALLAFPATEKAAAVVSSYATPLLEGCGSIKKGEVRIIGESDPVPFITAFVADELKPELKQALSEALMKVGADASLLISLETQKGFVPISKDENQTTSAIDHEERIRSTGKEEWPQFRGPFRDGTVTWLPEKLPLNADFQWKFDLPSEGMGGLAVASGSVIVGARDPLDHQDLWTCLDSKTGRPRWRLAYPAQGKLDYGNSPRATPLIVGDHAWLMGAFGHLHCVRINDGRIVWKVDLAKRFQSPQSTWGLSGSPLLIDGRLIVQPGGAQASLVALNPLSGEVLWTSPGLPAGYASFTTARWNDMTQLIGYDKSSFGGWDLSTGARIWTVIPREAGDFNVPSPIVHESGFILTSENNGVRLYRPSGQTNADFEATQTNSKLSPDAHSPVLCGERLLGIHSGLHCLSLNDGLKTVWNLKDRAFRGYGTLIANQDRVLAITFKEELVLIDPHQNEPKILSRLKLSEDGTDCWSHPALADRALFLRLGHTICRLDLDQGDVSNPDRATVRNSN